MRRFLSVAQNVRRLPFVVGAVAGIAAPISQFCQADTRHPSRPEFGALSEPFTARKSVRNSNPASPPLLRYAVADAVEAVLPSVVHIQRVSRPEWGANIFGFQQDSIDVSCGSGFVISADGDILTNAHVVADLGANSAKSSTKSTLEITLSSGEKYSGRVVAVDMGSDIAVVHVDAPSQLPVAKLGDSDRVRAGEFVVAVGSPLALSNSCSFGVISSIRRDLEACDSEAPAGLTYLQTDLAINPGSSGGPLVSLDGDVLGVCSKKIGGGVEGIGFAIPIAYAQGVVQELRTHGHVRRPFLGLALISLTPDFVSELRRDSSYRLPSWLKAELDRANASSPLGLMISEVKKGGPGDRAGLQAGDVVVSVDDCQTRTTSEFLAAMNFKVQRKVAIKLRRAATGQIYTATVLPEALPT